VTDRPRALAVLIAVFLVGCIIGSAGSFIWMKRPFGPFNQEIRNGSPGPGQERRRMADLLQLTPEQQTRFREIMAESRRQLFQLQLEQSPKIQTIRNETNRRLLSILNEEQQKKFEGFVKEMENRRGRVPGGRQFGPPTRPMPEPAERQK
jgi:uncharacterized membrane protein